MWYTQPYLIDSCCTGVLWAKGQHKANLFVMVLYCVLWLSCLCLLPVVSRVVAFTHWADTSSYEWNIIKFGVKPKSNKNLTKPKKDNNPDFTEVTFHISAGAYFDIRSRFLQFATNYIYSSIMLVILNPKWLRYELYICLDIKIKQTLNVRVGSNEYILNLIWILISELIVFESKQNKLSQKRNFTLVWMSISWTYMKSGFK